MKEAVKEIFMKFFYDVLPIELELMEQANEEETQELIKLDKKKNKLLNEATKEVISIIEFEAGAGSAWSK